MFLYHPQSPSLFHWSKEFPFHSYGLKSYFFEVIGSTNDMAKDHFSTQEPAVFISLRQNAGRGQAQREWLNADNPHGAFLVSYALFPDKCPPPHITLEVGQRLKKSLEKHWPISLEIKEPNDLLIGNKKCAGILCETIQQGSKVQWVVGIGLNVFSAPSALENSSFFIAEEALRKETWLSFLGDLTSGLLELNQNLN